MANDNISQFDYYNHNIEPNTTINSNKKGALWTVNTGKPIQCCVDNSINKNVWKKLNPNLHTFDKKLNDLEKKIIYPDYLEQLNGEINGYSRQIVARYFCIDGDDGDNTYITIGNAGFTLSPHYYYRNAGNDEYGMVALRLRDIGYMGTINRKVTNTTYNDVPSSITLANGKKIELECTNSFHWTYRVKGWDKGERLPLWPMIPNFAVTKVKFYHIPYDERAAPYRYGNLWTNKSYKDLLYSIPFPYDRYDQCHVTEFNAPTNNIVGWKRVSLDEYNRHWDTRKYLDPIARDIGYIPLTSGPTAYNYTDLGLGMQLWLGNGRHETFADVYYEGYILDVIR